MDGDALELALALYRAPDKRFALLARPLPDDIDRVLQLATGAESQLREAAALHGESEQTILEAVRFYLQQVLFQPDADAYRVLGLTSNAEPERVQRHYRWLQSWLHPDRRGEEWEALLATRVNWAWRQLRTETGRREYAAESALSGMTNSDSRVEYTPVSVEQWIEAPLPQAVNWPRRIVLAVALISGIGLFVLGWTLHDAIEPEYAGASDQPRTAGDDSRQAVALMNSEAALPKVQAHSAVDSDEGTESAAREIVQIIVPAVQVLVEPVEVSGQARISDLRPRLFAATAVPEQPNSEVSPPQPVLAHLTQKESATTARVPVRESTVVRIEASQSQGPAPAKVITTVTPAVDISESAASAVDVRQDLVQRTNPEQASLASTPTAAPTITDNRDEIGRINLARQRSEEIAIYFSNARLQTPPVWNDVRGETDAEIQRTALFARNKSHPANSFLIETPVWRMSNNAAALSADYSLRRGSNVSESGKLSLDMVWREQMWLVTHIEIHPVQ